MGWDAACTRHCVWVHFKDKVANKEFLFFNTHWDHRGVIARSNSGLLLQEFIEKLQLRQNVSSVILVGDFNERLQDQGVQHLKLETCASFGNNLFGPTYTFPDWHQRCRESIDFIFWEGESLLCLTYGVLNDKFASGRLLSDHFPVLAVFEYKNVAIDEEDEDMLLAKALAMSLEGSNM